VTVFSRVRIEHHYFRTDCVGPQNSLCRGLIQDDRSISLGFRERPLAVIFFVFPINDHNILAQTHGRKQSRSILFDHVEPGRNSGSVWNVPYQLALTASQWRFGRDLVSRRRIARLFAAMADIKQFGARIVGDDNFAPIESSTDSSIFTDRTEYLVKLPSSLVLYKQFF